MGPSFLAKKVAIDRDILDSQRSTPIIISLKRSYKVRTISRAKLFNVIDIHNQFKIENSANII